MERIRYLVRPLKIFFFLGLFLLSACNVNTEIEFADGYSAIPKFNVENSSSQEGSSVNFSFDLDEPATQDYSIRWAIEYINSDNNDLISQSGITEVKKGDKTFTISIPTSDDNSFEEDEEFNLILTEINGLETNEIVAKGTIANDDPEPVVQFQNISQTKNENGGVATILVILDIAAGVDVYVPYTLSGTADASDHNLIADLLYIPAGDVATGFAITITDDNDPELDEDLIITLNTPINGQLGTKKVYTLSIMDNDGGINITTPLATDFINLSNENSFTISGTCSTNGQEVTISVDDTNGATAAVTPGIQPICNTNAFTANLDLSSLDDNTITITASHLATNDTVSLTKDTAVPTVTITSPIATDYINLSNESSFTVSGACSENGREVTISADDTNGGTAAVTPGVQPTCTANAYTVNLDLSSLDDDTITITADHNDVATNSATQASVSLTKDTAAPTMTIEQSVSETIGTCTFTNQSDPAVVFPIEFKISTNEAINASTLEVADIANGGTAGGTTLTWTITSCGDDQNFSLKATAVDPMGTVIPSITTSKISDVAGNTNTSSSSSTDNSVNYLPNLFLWIGGVDSNWSTNGNWSGGTAPGNSDVATFDNSCGANCNVTVDSNIDVAGVDIKASYTGTITQGNGNTITIGSSNWTQAGGTFTGGDATSPMNIHEFSLSGGVFNAPASTLHIGYLLGVGSTDNTDGFIITGGTFNAGTGTVKFAANSAANAIPVTVININVDNSLFFNNLEFTATDTTSSGGKASAVIVISSEDTLIVNGNLILTDGSLIGGNIELKGNLIGTCVDGSDTAGNCAGGGNTLITMNNTSPQFIDAESNSAFPAVTFNNPTSISMSNISNNFSVFEFKLLQGTFNAPDATLSIGPSVNLGTISNTDGFTISGGTFNPGSGTIRFNGTSSSNIADVTVTKIDVDTSLTFNNLEFSANDLTSSGGRDEAVIEIASGDTLIVNGDLTFSDDKLTGGSIELKGNLISTCVDGSDYNGFCPGTGDSLFTLNGTANQSINLQSSLPLNSISINKSTGSIFLNSDLNLNLTNQDLSIINGDLDLNGYDLIVDDQLNVGDGVGAASTARIIKGCSITTAGTTNTNPTDGEIVGSSSSPNITISDATITEGGDLVFNVALSEGVCGGDFTVNYTVNDGTATTANLDYSTPATDSDATPNDGILTLSAGTTSGTITISTNVDATMELDETLTVVLNTPSHGTLTDDSGVGVIENDDDNGFIWTGDAGDGDFSNGANWSNGSTAPGSSDIAMFDDTCNDVPANCDVNTSSNISVEGLWINNGYTGTFTQSSGHAITVDAADFIQLDGIFVGGDTTITLNNNLAIYGGDFTATSSTLNSLGDIYISDLAIFSHNSGTFRCGPQNSNKYWEIVNHKIYNLDFSLSGGGVPDLYITGILNIENTLHIQGGFKSTLNGDVIYLEGDLILDSHEGNESTLQELVLVGNGTQTITSTGGLLPNTRVASTGTVDFNSQTVVFGRNFTYTSGTVLTNGSTVIFSPNNYNYSIDSSGMSFNNVIMQPSGGPTPDLTLVSDMDVNGDLELNFCDSCKLEGQAINLAGNLNITTTGFSSTSVTTLGSLRLDGSGIQTITSIAGYTPSLIIASSGTVDISNQYLRVGGHLTYQSGTVITTNSTVQMSNRDHYQVDVSAAGLEFNDFRATGSGGATPYLTILGTLIVKGDYYIDGVTGYVNGVMELYGDYISSSPRSNKGTLSISFLGTNDQIIDTPDNDMPLGDMFINKSSGKVILANDWMIDEGAQDLTILDGDLDLNGYNLSVDVFLNVGDGVGAASSARVLKGCSTITAGAQNINPTDGEIVGTSETPNVTISDATIAEGGNLVFTVSLSEQVCSDFTVNYTVSDGTATTANSDYSTPATDSDASPNDGILTISAGTTSGTITIATNVDATMELDETLTVVLNTPSHGTLTDDSGVGVIENDDDNGFIWTGDAGDNDFSNGANWSNGSTAPGASDIAFFDDTCNDVPTNCDVNTSGNISVQGLWINADYPGTFTQNNNHDISVSTSYWQQLSGTFVGGDTTSDITVHEFVLRGGVFNAPDGNFDVGYGVNTSNNFDGFTVMGGTFNAGTIGTTRFVGTASTCTTVTTQGIDVDSSITFNNLVFFVNDTNSGCGYGGAKLSIASADTLIVNGDLTFVDGIVNGGNIEHKGNLTVSCASTSDSDGVCAGGGSTVVTMNGTSPQQYSGTANALSPPLIIDNPTSVSPAAAGSFSVSKFELLQGTFNAPSVDFNVGFYVNNISQSDGFVVSGGTFNQGTATVKFVGSCYNSALTTTMVVDVPPGFLFNDLEIAIADLDGVSSSQGIVQIASGDTLTINGDLILTDGRIDGGNIDLKGNLIVNCADGSDNDGICAGGGTSVLTMNSSSPQTYSSTNGGKTPFLIIDNPTTVSPLSAGSNMGAWEFTLNQGTFVAPDGNFDVGYHVGGTSNTDGFTVSSGSFDANNGTLRLVATGASNPPMTSFTININNTLNLENLELITTETYSGPDGYDDIAVAIAAGDTLIVNSNLTLIDGKLNGGTIELKGDLNINCADGSDFIGICAGGGTTQLNFSGSSDQNISIAAGAIALGGLTSVDKTSGKVNLTSDFNFSTTGQDLSILNGTLDLNGYNLTVNDQLNVGDGVGAASTARILKGCSTITAGTQNVNPTDGEIVGSSSNPNVTISDATVTEGGNLVFNVTLSEGVCGGDFTVNYTINDGTATTANFDYSTPATDSDAAPSDGILTLTGGAISGTITIATITDSTMELDETLNVVLNTPSHGTLIDDSAIGTIENDDDNGFIWTGDAGDNDFNNGANWSNGSTAPGSSDIVMFDDTCNDVPANCDVNTSGNVSVSGLWFNLNYTDTFTQNASHTITVGANNWKQFGGTFIGGDSNITVNSAGQIEIGSFTSSTATLNINDNWMVSDAATFNANGGLFHIYNTSGTSQIFPGTGEYDNVQIQSACAGAYDLNNKTMIINGQLELKGNCDSSSSLNNGILLAKGDVVITNNGKYGTALLKIGGSGNQTIDTTGFTSNNFALNFEIASTGGTVSFVGANFRADNDFTYTSGNVDFGTTTLRVWADGNIVPGPINFADVVFESNCGGVRDLNGGTMNILGNLTLDHACTSGNSINNGTLNVQGNISFLQSGMQGSANYILSGANDQTVFFAATAETPLGTWTINKTNSSNIVTLLSNAILNASGQDLNILNGTLDLYGYNLTINDQLNVGDGIGAASSARIIKGCSTVTAGTQNVNSTDGEIVISSSNPNVAISDATVTEGGNLVFNVILSEGVCGGDFTINYTVSDGTATTANSDYSTPATDSDASPNDGVLTLSAGTTSGTITIATTTDSNLEFDETLTVVLDTPSHGSITDDTAVGTIENDDDNGFIWTGDAGDNDFSNGANWSNGSIAPGASDIAMFDDTCNDVPTNCDVITSNSISIDGVLIAPNYSGIFTQGNGHTISVGGSNWIQNGGTFIGGDVTSNVDANKFTLDGGIFNAPAGTFTVGTSVTNLNHPDGFAVLSGTFNPGTGTVQLHFNNSVVNSGTAFRVAKIIAVSPINFYNLNLRANEDLGTERDGAYFEISTGGTLNVSNILTLQDGYIESGEISVTGNVVIDCAGGSDYDGACAGGGSTILRFNGASPQTYEATASGGKLPEVVINNPTSVSPVQPTNNIKMTKFSLSQGTFVAPSATLEVGGYIGPAQTDGFTVNSGSFDHNNGTVYLNAWASISNATKKTVLAIDINSSIEFNNLILRARDSNSGSGYDEAQIVIGAGDSLVVNGILTIEDGIFNGGTLVTKGNVELGCPAGSDSTGICAGGGTTALSFSGTSNQTLTIETGGNLVDGNITVDKSSGKVTLLSAIDITSNGQDLNILNGDFDLNGHNLTVNDQLNVGDGVGSASSARIIKGCSTITAGTQNVNPTDGEIVNSSENPDITITDESELEGSDLVFTVSLSEGVCSGDFTVNYTVNNGTATTANSDYNATPDDSDATPTDGTLTLSGGATSGTITVHTTTDATLETDEYLTLSLNTASHGTITDNTGVGTLRNEDGQENTTILASTGTNNNSEWDGT
ncbi:MAG: hypothetical protein KDD58_05375, partial [Bdellovibrionales bacterium]|nr:hypothetical protein [Bdellovibrionales bacterium]